MQLAEWRANRLEQRLDLTAAELEEAQLVGADLGPCDLRGANLRGADLRFAVLRWADLRGADLTGASLWWTTFGDADLRDVRALERVAHVGPSIVDERTLRTSWPLPQVFLRDCGFSDELIAFLNATLGQAIEFYSCFISYSSKDDDFAGRLHTDLQDKGVRCWFAPENLKIGDKFGPRIDEAIRLHDKLLLILSENSVQSPWVESEVEAAFEKNVRAGRVARSGLCYSQFG